MFGNPNAKTSKFTFVESKKLPNAGEIRVGVDAKQGPVDEATVRFRTLFCAGQTVVQKLATANTREVVKIADPSLTKLHYTLETTKLDSVPKAGKVVVLTTSAAARYLMTFKGSKLTQSGTCSIYRTTQGLDEPCDETMVMKIQMQAGMKSIMSEVSGDGVWQMIGSASMNSMTTGFAAEVLATKDTGLYMACFLASYLLVYTQVYYSTMEQRAFVGITRLELTARAVFTLPGFEADSWRKRVGDERQCGHDKRLFEACTQWAPDPIDPTSPAVKGVPVAVSIMPAPKA